MLSLRTKTQRVANDWKVVQALDDGKNVTSDYNQFELSLSKGGSAKLSAEYTLLGNKISYSTNGTWSFVSNKEKISFDFENNSADGVYTILRLTKDEMWLKEDGETVELHFAPR